MGLSSDDNNTEIKKNGRDRQIHQDIHDLAHMLSDARAWFDRIDKKLEEIMLREEKSQRKDDHNRVDIK